PVCVVIVLGACNSTNLIDGLDGLCAGVIAIVGLALMTLAAALSTGAEGLQPRVALAAAVAGAALGFLPWNFRPAKIFMGDAGSMLLGYICGMLMLSFAGLDGDSAHGAGSKPLLAALMAFAVPVLDSALAIARRKLAGKPIFKGDRSHFYDQLVDRGLSVRQTVLVCYLLGGIAGGLALAALALSTTVTLLVYLAALAVALVAVIRARMLRVDPDPV
ncbi:MAG: undecaprenyl/decaprenyl-phosphate alpha-N-acetylglucosaminyl 1-phosphate transferase, partial [Phycisphaerales bacterium]|nr:undecaprenyl/decaprenyl-phosphate alpha-N-acetylglucosaminyl 1-phosphate transferase [Phycisphaerales bacterium]